MNITPDRKYSTRTQVQWIYDNHPLKIMEKSCQVGATHATDYRTVNLVSEPGAHFDAFISSHAFRVAGSSRLDRYAPNSLTREAYGVRPACRRFFFIIRFAR